MFLSFPFTRLGYALFPTAVANGIICGAFTFCESIPFFLAFILSRALDYDTGSSGLTYTPPSHFVVAVSMLAIAIAIVTIPPLEARQLRHLLSRRAGHMRPRGSCLFSHLSSFRIRTYR